jgi:Galactokinase
MIKTGELKARLRAGAYDESLKDIYMGESTLEYQQRRYEAAVAEYEQLFGVGEVEIYSAPGRSEIGGNHTDHQRGMVLATSVNLDTIAVVERLDGNEIEVVSKGYAPIRMSADVLEKQEDESGKTVALIRGVLNGMQERGHQIGGFRAYMTSDVISAAGLSSSACFETLIGTIISGLYNDMQIASQEIAQIGQYAENVYFDKPCGLMDQMACAVGGLIHIDFADPKNPQVNQVAVDFGKYEYNLCVVDTKGSHADLTDDYADIPAEMKAVAGCFGKSFLREVDEVQFITNIAEIREQVGDRAVLRALHFFEEEKVVVNEVTALQNDNFPEFLRLITQSGNSSYRYLQNIYSNKDVNSQAVSIALAMSEIILKEHGVSRVHGGGFAGTIQAFVKNSYVKEYKEQIEKVFGEGSCYVLNIRKYGGIQVVN